MLSACVGDRVAHDCPPLVVRPTPPLPTYIVFGSVGENARASGHVSDVGGPAVSAHVSPAFVLRKTRGRLRKRSRTAMAMMSGADGAMATRARGTYTGPGSE